MESTSWAFSLRENCCYCPDIIPLVGDCNFGPTWHRESISWWHLTAVVCEPEIEVDKKLFATKNADDVRQKLLLTSL